MRRRVQVDSLAEARRRFEQWRKFRGSGGRIPHELWIAAAKAAAAHGAEVVAADLGVDLGRLQRWVRIVDGGEPDVAPAAFVELPPLAGLAGMADASSAAECTLELEEPSGRKLRISLRGPATTQALEFGRVLWRASP
ncbi:MAG: hypothetical protein ACRD4Q_09540 [Candidatus Acidiferrales bacterium]